MFVDFFGGETALDELDVFGVRFGKGFMFEIIPENPEFANSKFNCYQVGLHHFALQLENKNLIDKTYEQLLKMKVKILDKPAFYPDYEEGYYAVFLEDLNGFKMEFMRYEK